MTKVKFAYISRIFVNEYLKIRKKYVTDTFQLLKIKTVTPVAKITL